MTKREVIEMLTAKAECIRRESSGIDVDCNFRNCDECDLCYKQGTMEDQMEALGVAISALRAQNLQQTCNRLATNTIDRQAAIDALKEHRALFCDNTPDTFSKLSYGEKCRVDELDTAISTLVDLPPAQPTQTDTSNTLKALDCVERQAAIDAANDWLLDCLKIQKQDRSCGLIRRLEDLPSAQPKIVRCRDCNNYQTDWETSYPNRHYCATMDSMMPEDGFCSYAERRTDE